MATENEEPTLNRLELIVREFSVWAQGHLRDGQAPIAGVLKRLQDIQDVSLSEAAGGSPSDDFMERLEPKLRALIADAREDRLEVMFRLQNRLEIRTLGEAWWAWPPEDLDLPLSAERQRYLTEWTDKWLTCITQECAELRDWTPWKHWSQRLGNKRDDVVPWSAEHLKEVRLELVDQFHFFMALCLIWGLTPQMLYDIYLEKNQVNHARQNQGDY